MTSLTDIQDAINSGTVTGIIVQVTFPETEFGGVLIERPSEFPVQVIINGDQGGGQGAGPGTDAVTSVFGRVGDVTAQEGDYDEFYELKGSGDVSGVASIVNGNDFVDVAFSPGFADAGYLFIETRVSNMVDADPLNIWSTFVVSKTKNGFRIRLNGLVDSDNYKLNWVVRGKPLVPLTPATTYLLSGPPSGPIGAAASFTVQLPSGTSVASPVTVTPSDGGVGGTFSPTSVILTTDAPSAGFTYTPSTYGDRMISATNNGGLSNPSPVTMSVNVTTYTFTGPASGDVSVPSAPFTVALPVGAVVSGTITITPNDGGGGGVFTPSSVGLTTGSPSATFTYTPGSTGAKTLSVTNDRSLTDPAPITYTSSAPSPHLLNNLTSYWKLDEATGVTKNDSQGTNHLTSVDGGSFAFIINNGAFFSDVNWLKRVDNASLHVTGDFTFSIWVRVDVPGNDRHFLTKFDGTTLDYGLNHSATTGFGFNAGSVAAGVGAPAGGFSVHHLVGWWDSSDNKARLRVDDANTYVSSAGALNTPNAGPFLLGALVESNQIYNWKGLIDEVGFWNRKLTAIEITALYNGGAGLPFSSFTT